MSGYPRQVHTVENIMEVVIGENIRYTKQLLYMVVRPVRYVLIVGDHTFGFLINGIPSLIVLPGKVTEARSRFAEWCSQADMVATRPLTVTFKG
jgi:hypothetical protein